MIFLPFLVHLRLNLATFRYQCFFDSLGIMTFDLRSFFLLIDLFDLLTRRIFFFFLIIDLPFYFFYLMIQSYDPDI